MAKTKENKMREISDLRALLDGSAERFGTHCAFREKRDGIYQDISFARYAAETKMLSAVLSARFAPGARVLIVGENCYAWALGFMALVSGGMAAVPIDASLSAKGIAAAAALADLRV